MFPGSTWTVVWPTPMSDANFPLGSLSITCRQRSEWLRRGGRVGATAAPGTKSGTIQGHRGLHHPLQSGVNFVPDVP